MGPVDKDIDHDSLIDLRQLGTVTKTPPIKKQKSVPVVKVLSPPALKSDISKLKLFATSCNDSNESLTLPLIKSTSTKNFQQQSMRRNKDWMEYAKEKQGDKVLPSALGTSEVLRAKYTYRRKILAELLAKKTKAKAAKFHFK
eukprot:TRINITY_DN21856_c0_g1_i1.p1 TRINITY_DN21856_c0_g1~~TRINITY_DN21856_c0_g1_i1.p1  ORF type:complete len:143 (-),score=32.29 TRINITY_DN21856_c0_g1_i1:45-473(-)